MKNKISGVYCITNKFNNKRYIGSSVDIDRRLKNHKLNFRKGSHPNRYMQKEYDNNPDLFKYDILKENINRDELVYYERYYMIKYLSFYKDKGYNEKMSTINKAKYNSVLKRIKLNERNFNKMKVELIAHTQNPEEVVARAAKLCYSKSSINEILSKMTKEKINSFIKGLVSMGHMSPFEHVSFTFGIEGISRSCTHQLVRHRIASYSQQSQRYVDMEQSELILPEIYKDADGVSEIVEEEKKLYLKSKLLAYKKLLLLRCNIDYKDYSFDESLSDKDQIKLLKELFPDETKYIEKEVFENSRAFLPNACETKIIMTMNARSLMNFFKLRCCNRAQKEIRDLAIEMLKQVKEVAPEIFANSGPECLRTKCPENKMSCGKPWKK